MSLPRLRPVECVVVPDPREGRAIVLRDTEGIAPSAIQISMRYGPVISRLDGTRSVTRIADDVSRDPARAISARDVERLVSELDQAYFLDSPRFRARRDHIVQAFHASPVRAPTHAGGAYPDDPSELRRYIERECFPHAKPRTRRGRLVGLSSPHMDLWRAARGYGHAYAELRDALAPEADTFVLLGTSHAPMRRPFSICAKAFATPLGELEPDKDSIDELSRAARFDVHEDAYFHKQEHSVEFQAVFVKHVLGARRAKIIPILCGLGDAQARRRDPAKDGAAESFLGALARLVERLGERVVVVSGADLAHVGPRFGDPEPLDAEGREALAKRDRASVDLAVARAPREFFDQATSDLDTRRVCGVGPIYTLLRSMPAGVSGEALSYEQHVDPNEGSIVSHTSLGFYLA